MPRPTARPAPRFTAPVAAQVLAHACEAVGLNGSAAIPLRLSENALFHLPAESVIVRIARTMEYWADAVNEVKCIPRRRYVSQARRARPAHRGEEPAQPRPFSRRPRVVTTPYRLANERYSL